ncbi:orotidine-5'-phosphate decarboxylase [Corynebacterium hadale]|uniref:orotidine-5'-phosphate decarboxylase n=1 Tax=Corynebacterium hadale TaxID=2026255 RepID=UPI001EF38067|nr:orotidine-5'-phosphate decarboxylase [Corynebacterium hadale]MCG7253228.1 orotidine-5'-phosphate decarboxylase [Corynebacterium hadale]MCG7255525.1 orotidine-5'-phosphate decarboxylase [Corynebacterium hadale]MCG7264384.1 orotidine-5'-phosphate decarboxylase [Corynebacterium hadale]
MPSSAPQPGFGGRLVAAGERHGRLCVGIDPHAALLKQWGLPDSVDGLRRFAEICVEAFAGHVALVKPQVAFFERFGARGFAVLEETLASLRERGTLSVADAKRGDIGSTMAGYAAAWLEPGAPLEADAVTLTPYLGVGSLEPAIELAGEHGKGVFIMAANSNPEAEAFQSSLIDDRTISQYMVDGCAAYNSDSDSGIGHVGHVGVVVGATVGKPPLLDHLNAPVLMPGVGAQGATMDDVARIAGAQARLVFPNVSRSVLSAGPDVGKLRDRAGELAK